MVYLEKEYDNYEDTWLYHIIIQKNGISQRIWFNSTEAKTVIELLTKELMKKENIK